MSYGLWRTRSRRLATSGSRVSLTSIIRLSASHPAFRILRGNLAPGGAVAKITGKEGLGFTGKARAFDTEDEFVSAVESGSIKKGEKTVVVLRYLGPKGGPGTFQLSCLLNLRDFICGLGMPEMLKPTSLIMGAGLGHDVACLTDGRFSGGCVCCCGCRPTLLTIRLHHRSHGFCIGHVVPEAQEGGPIALVHDGDVIAVDAVKNSIELQVSPEELEKRRAAWKAPPLKVHKGTLFKYTKVVSDASHGCITDA